VVSLKNRISGEELNRRLCIESVVVIVRRGRMGWFGHLERKDTLDWTGCLLVETLW
jgi:predicted methyltransferase MtxX (methanogen marker protein 4)